MRAIVTDSNEYGEGAGRGKRPGEEMGGGDH